MSLCHQCGATIEFRHIDGVCIPIHLHGGSCTGSSTRGSARGFSYGKSMRLRAAELGHSLVFPADCWHCNSQIFLYANEEGRFAIFNEVGEPWTKHECQGWSPGDQDFIGVNQPLSTRYRLPIPRRATAVELSDGALLRGTVIRIRPQFCEVFTGEKIATVVPSRPVRIGQFVQGVVHEQGSQLVFELNVLPMPDAEDLEDSIAVAMPRKDRHVRRITRRFFSAYPVAYWCIVDEQLKVIDQFPFSEKKAAEARLQALRRSTSRDLILQMKKLS